MRPCFDAGNRYFTNWKVKDVVQATFFMYYNKHCKHRLASFYNMARMEETMNLEIANRLVALRKENHLSQEALAEKLGISRQAVSKWERAEASPDTDNLIALAKLYHISLDELLKIHEDEDDLIKDEPPDDAVESHGNDTEAEQVLNDTGKHSSDAGGRYEYGDDYTEDEGDKVHVGFDGIHVKDKNGEVHVSWRGIHVNDKRNDNEVHIDRNGIRVNGDKAECHIFTRGKDAELPLGIFAIVSYIIIGACFDMWHPGWLIFFLVPIISSLINAVHNHNPDLFAYPILVLLIFLYVGFIYHIWHPTWVVFLTIPLYYSFTGYVKRTRAKDSNDQENKTVI